MQTDEDLGTLIRRNDHLNVLRYLRVHQIRDPQLAVRQGRMLLGDDLAGKKLPSGVDELAHRAALEQVGLAALDDNDGDVAALCLRRLEECGVEEEAPRFRVLRARTLEAAGDYAGANLAYDDLLRDNPANLVALKRKYCILRAQPNKRSDAVVALNRYLQQNYSDAAAWYEMAKLRLELGDYGGAAFALEEVLMGSPSDSRIHCELSECYATIGGAENLVLARKHTAQALELDPTNRRALFGLVSAANASLEDFSASSSSKKKDNPEADHEAAVAKELVRYGAEQLLVQYKGTAMFSRVKALMSEYTADL